MADEKVVLEIVLDDGTVKKVFANIKRDGNDAAKSIERGFVSSFTSSLFSIKGAIAGVIATLGGAAAFKSIVSAGVESEKAWRGFNVALASTGQLTTQATNDFQAYADSLQRVTGVQDEVIANGAALLVNVGRLSNEALKPATQAALDLSAALQIGPEQAFNLLAKAASGSTDMLGRYGIRIDENIPKGERFAAVLQLIQERFSGQAAAAANTFEGALLRVTNGISDITENIGKLIARSPAAIAVLKTLGDTINAFGERISAAGKGSDPIKPLILSALEFGKTFNQFVIVPLEVGFNLAKVFVDGFIVGLNIIAAGLGRVGQALVMVFQAVGVDLNEKLIRDINTFTENSQERIASWSLVTGEALNNVANIDVSKGLREFNETLITSVESSAAGVQQVSNNMANAESSANSAMSAMAQRAQQINKAISSTLAGGIASAVQQMTRSLAAGQLSFGNFAKAIIGIAGDMAIQLGTVLIGAGIGIEALKTLGGAAAIAAGIGLVAIGTIMKSLAGGEGGMGVSAGANFTGDGTATPGTTPGLIDNTDQLERDKPQTAVTINVQGDILDRRETGLAIAEILAENFDLNGQRIVTGAIA